MTIDIDTQWILLQLGQFVVGLMLPDGEVVDMEKCKRWLQQSAYSGYVPSVKAGWVLGRPGVIALRETRPIIP